MMGYTFQEICVHNVNSKNADISHKDISTILLYRLYSLEMRMKLNLI